MTDHVNKYVIDVESGHPGFRAYTVISTLGDMRKLVEALSRSLGDPAAAGKLWSDYATVAHGQSSRVELRFVVEPDLAPYHTRSLLVQVRRLLGCVVLLAALYFAWVGLSDTVARLVR
jgi:hypothetical protein